MFYLHDASKELACKISRLLLRVDLIPFMNRKLQSQLKCYVLVVTEFEEETLSTYNVH